MVHIPMPVLVTAMVIVVLAYVLPMSVLVHAQSVRPLDLILMNVIAPIPLIVFHKLAPQMHVILIALDLSPL